MESESSRRRAEISEELLLNLARQYSSVEDILNVFFDFLQRRTDFFHVLEPPEAPASNSSNSSSGGRQQAADMGFPQGHAEAMIRHAFAKAQLNYRRRAQPHLLPHTKQQQQQKAVQQQQQQAAQREQQQREEGGCRSLSPTASPSQKASSGSQAPSQSSSSSNGDSSSSSKSGNSSSSKEEGRDKGRTSGRGREIATWNGGVCDRYRWTQGLRDLTVQLQLDPEIYTSKKDLSVIITPTTLTVRLKGQVLLQGELYEPIDAAASVWQVEEGALLLLSLEKSRENWWGSVLKGDPPIDTTKIESVKRVEEFDDATQAHIRKMLYEQQQRLRGEKTSSEIEKEKLLEKAWNAEGSPFKGTPFDPSRLNINNHSDFFSS